MEIMIKLKIKEGIEIELSEKEIIELKDKLNLLFTTQIYTYPITTPRIVETYYTTCDTRSIK